MGGQTDLNIKEVRDSCTWLCLLSAGINGVYHYSQPVLSFFKRLEIILESDGNESNVQTEFERD